MFETRVQLTDESVELYADALRRMAARLGVDMDGGPVKLRFLKGLASTQIRAKLESVAYLMADTFNALEAAASYHKSLLRRDKPGKLPSQSSASSGAESRKSMSDRLTVEEVQRMMDSSVKKQVSDNIQKHVIDLKQEIVSQKQTIVRLQNEQLKQTKPERPCFTCGSKDHFKRHYPKELAKRGQITRISMAELIEFDLSQIDAVDALEEMSQRFCRI